MKKVYIIVIFFALGSMLYAINLSYDLSLLPKESGSGFITSFRLGFTERFSSRIAIRDSKNSVTATTLQGYGPNSLQHSDSENLQLDLLPLELKFSVKSFDGVFSFGVSYLSIEERQHSIFDDVNGYLEIPAGQLISYRNIRKAKLFSPRVGFDIDVEPIKNFFFHYSGHISPLYFLLLDQEMHYSSLDVSSTNRVQRWSTPYLEHSFSIKYRNWVNLAIYHTYQRLDFQTMDWDDSGTNLKGNDDIQEYHDLRIGLEPILSFNRGVTNFKVGFYWHLTVSKSSYWEMDISRNKFAISFGVVGN